MSKTSKSSNETKDEKRNAWALIAGAVLLLSACAHQKIEEVKPDEASRLDPQLVRDSVVYGPGTEGSPVPDISAPRLRAERIPARREGNRLVGEHVDWVLDGEPSILGTPGPQIDRAKLYGGAKK